MFSQIMSTIFEINLTILQILITIYKNKIVILLRKSISQRSYDNAISHKLNLRLYFVNIEIDSGFDITIFKI